MSISGLGLGLGLGHRPTAPDGTAADHAVLTVSAGGSERLAIRGRTPDVSSLVLQGKVR